MDITITATGVTELTEEEVADLIDTYAALKGLPANRVANIDFETPEEATSYAKAFKAWAVDNGHKFLRKGDIKGNPTQLTFRIYDGRETADDQEND